MSQTADRYSKALFELSQEQKNLEAIEEAIVALKNLVRESEDLRSFLADPLLSEQEQAGALKAMFEGKIPALAYQFLLLVGCKGRLNILEDILESFENMYLASTNQIRVDVKTALPVNEQEKTFIAQKLEEKFHQKIIPQWVLDPSLIGGFRIFAQGKLYDYSFKNQLERFLQQTT
jgi:F-type H+-transporting ATPase subunit delta